jgi:hypothetical protein
MTRQHPIGSSLTPSRIAARSLRVRLSSSETTSSAAAGLPGGRSSRKARRYAPSRSSASTLFLRSSCSSSDRTGSCQRRKASSLRAPQGTSCFRAEARRDAGAGQRCSPAGIPRYPPLEGFDLGMMLLVAAAGRGRGCAASCQQELHTSSQHSSWPAPHVAPRARNPPQRPGPLPNLWRCKFAGAHQLALQDGSSDARQQR